MSQAEPYIAEMRREASRVDPPGTDALAQCVSLEVRAWNQLWRGEWEAASESATEVAQQVTEEVLSAYRAFWLYLAASWRAHAASDSGSDTLASSADNLLKRAYAAAKGASWLRETAPLDEPVVELDTLDRAAVTAVSQNRARSLSHAKWLELSSRMITGLQDSDPSAFEPALSLLGGLLGAEAFKPEGKGRADSVWLFGKEWWLTLEAKSDTKAEGLLSMTDVRQANSQLDSLRADQGCEPPGDSRSIIITPKAVIDPDAVDIALPHLYITNPETLQVLAADVTEAWRSIRLKATDLSGSEAEAIIAAAFAEHHVLPSDVRERIADQRLGD